MQDLESESRSRIADIERAIETVRTFNEQNHQASESGTLQQSLDLLKIYTSATPYLQKGSEKEKQLASKVVDVAKKYNEVVQQKKLPPATVSGILKQFFLRIAGNREYKTFTHHEIHIPHSAASPYKITQKNEPSDKILSVLQTVQRNSDADYSIPKQSELDLFRAKCLPLLLEQDTVPFSLDEALLLINTGSITYELEEGAYLLADNILHERLQISPLPGIEVLLEGAFQRDPFHPDLAIPIKASFQCHVHIEQTGFPHPMQYVGFALHEKLLPSCILRPQMCPKFASLLKQKQQLTEELLPSGSLYKKAKAQLKQKKELFNESQELFLVAKKLPLAPLEYSPNWYEELSNRSARFNEQAFGYPISYLQNEWLLKNNPRIPESPHAECQAIMLQALSEAYDKTVHTFGRAGISLHLMQLSEHLNFEPCELTQFERTLLTSLIRQQLIFIHELRELEEKNLYSHIKTTIQEEIALFKCQPSTNKHTLEAQELAEELFQYYSVRFETT